MTLFLFSEILLFVPLCQFDNLSAYFFQFTGFFGKFVEKRKRFLFSINGMNDLYTLVIVIPDTAELLIESGELGIIFLRFLVNLHHLELSAEDTGEDKFGLVLLQSPNQKIPDRKTKCVIKTHINIKQNVIFGAKLKPV